MNKERQDLTKKYLQQAEDYLLKSGQVEDLTGKQLQEGRIKSKTARDTDPQILSKSQRKLTPVATKTLVLHVISDDIPEGIVGLVAGKLQEKYHRPTLVMTKTADGYKGSARSLPGFHITDALENLSQYLLKFGGHAQAAGFTVKMDSIDEFIEALNDYARKHLSDDELKNELYIDFPISTKAISLKLLDTIGQLEPFGYKMRKPKFLLPHITIVTIKPMGKDNRHMKVKIKGDGASLHDLIVFNYADYNIDWQEGDVIDAVVRVDENVWNGNRSVQLMLVDWRDGIIAH